MKLYHSTVAMLAVLGAGSAQAGEIPVGVPAPVAGVAFGPMGLVIAGAGYGVYRFWRSRQR